MSASSASPTAKNASGNAAAAKALQERLHALLSRLSSTIDTVKTWPSTDGDDASIHVITTTKLITGVLELTGSLKRVENVIKEHDDLRKSLQDCPIPINLLDLLDHGNGLNPDCFSRGLLREAMGQLAGLKRRKLALEMLGAAVQTGLDKQLNDVGSGETASGSKRQRSDEEHNNPEDGDEGASTKKPRVEPGASES